jgi:hypothetical protein
MNLCTKELSFFLRLRWSFALQGADVFLDGRKLGVSDWNGNLLEVPAGNHEIRVKKSGYEPVIKNLELGLEDRGDQWIDLTAEELRLATEP